MPWSRSHHGSASGLSSLALRWGARRIAEDLARLGVEHVHEEYEGGHFGTAYRYEASLRWLVPRLLGGEEETAR